jgi:MFS family permease
VALGLLAYDLAGPNAGAVLGIALALKMVAYVGLSPVIAAHAHRVDRRGLLVGLDLVRAAVLFLLPFVTQVWEVFVLILVVNACAAGFTPAFQATIPEVLPDEEDYTRALSLSRVAYDVGDMLAPAIAAAMLLLVDFDALFAVNGVTFLISASLITGLALPKATREVSDRSWARITLGARRFRTVPRLRGLLALNFAAAAASATVIVNTVTLVRDDFARGGTAVAVALAAAGIGSVVTAAAVPRLLRRVSDRAAMLTGGLVLAGGLSLVGLLPSYGWLLVLWVALGAGLALVQTPAGRLIQRSGDREDLPPLFAAQFALSHACWLVTYPVAGAVGAAAGIGLVALALGLSCAASVVLASRLWTE